jgi:subtilisin-like proprotein convertase family protein
MKMTVGRKTWLASVVGALAALAVFASAASAETFTTTQETDIAIPASGKASPYPSKINVQGGDGTITDINVNLSLSQTFPNDLDIALVSPSGNAEILMSDACGESGALSNVTFTFDDQAGSSLSEAGPCSSGTFKPTNFGAGDTWESPGPVVSTAQLNNFNGEGPNGNWELFIVDDLSVGGGSGTITSWSVTITTKTAEVIIPATGTSGKAKPYPSEKTFNTPPGKVISDLNLTTNGFFHTFPDDVDMLLVGPRRGANVLAMSDACGSTDIRNFIWIFDDEAAQSMTDNPPDGSFGNCIFISVKPSNFETAIDTFPAPAPVGPYGSAMSAFDGLEGGTFKLFVNDDASQDTGFINTWTLGLTTRDAADTGFSVGSVRVEEGGKAVLTVTRTGQTNLGPATINVSTGGAASAGSDYTAPPATLEFARGQATRTIEIPIVDDKVGEATERFNVVLSSPRDDARLNGITSAEVVIGPDNEFKFGKLKRNAKKGTAKLFVNVPGPGRLSVAGEQVKKVSKAVGGGNVGIPIKPKGNAVGVLEDAGSAKLRAKVTFTPTDGSAFSKTKKLKLILND